MTKHLEPFWEIFLTCAMPPFAPEYQILCMQEAYYAGAASVFAIVMDALDKVPSNEEGSQFLSELEDELISFMSRAIEKHQTQTKGESHAS
jgi:hypothetical protein